MAADVAYRQINKNITWLGRKSTGVCSTHSSFPRYDTDLFVRCGPGIEIKSIERAAITV